MNKWLIKILNYNCIIVVEQGKIALFGANQDKTLKLVEEALKGATSESAKDFSESFCRKLAERQLSVNVSVMQS